MSGPIIGGPQPNPIFSGSPEKTIENQSVRDLAKIASKSKLERIARNAFYSITGQTEKVITREAALNKVLKDASAMKEIKQSFIQYSLNPKSLEELKKNNPKMFKQFEAIANALKKEDNLPCIHQCAKDFSTLVIEIKSNEFAELNRMFGVGIKSEQLTAKHEGALSLLEETQNSFRVEYGSSVEQIHQEVTDRLISKGYDPNALPEDYTSKPPQDVEKVKSNLRILREFSKPDNEEFKSFVNERSLVFYQKLEERMDHLKELILSLHGIESKSGISTDELMEICEKNEKNLDSSLIQKMKDMIGDIKEIENQKLIDSQEIKSKEALTVTIKGQFYNPIKRYENETQTAMEIFRIKED